MDTTSAPWQKRFELSSCAASAIGSAIPANALGVAVVYEETTDADKIYLVVESRAGSLRDQCSKRLQTAKLPAVGLLTVAFRLQALSDSSPAAVEAACREQVILAGTIRRELKPAMR